MHIGYLIPEFPGQTHGFFWREIAHIEAEGNIVTIFSTRRPRESTTHAFTDAAAKRTFYLTDFQLRAIPAWLLATFRALSVIIRKDVRSLRKQQERWIKIFGLSIIGARLSQICRRDGIEHIHGHSCADAGYLLSFCKLAGGPPYSLSLHGDLSVYGRGHGFKFGHAKFVACVTESLREQVKNQLPSIAQEPQLIRMGIEPPRYQPKRVDGSVPRPLKLVTVARLNPMKGHRHAIAAVKALKKSGIEVHYDIIGEGDHYDIIIDLIKENGLEKEISMIGSLPNEEIVARLGEYDTFVLPSVGLGEAAPVAVMEAMAEGLPVVCSIIGGTPEMIQHKKTGFLFPQGDEAALTDILMTLATKPQIRQRVGWAGRAYAEKHFLTSASAAKLLHSIRQ